MTIFSTIMPIARPALTGHLGIRRHISSTTLFISFIGGMVGAEALFRMGLFQKRPVEPKYTPQEFAMIVRSAERACAEEIARQQREESRRKEENENSPR